MSSPRALVILLCAVLCAGGLLIFSRTDSTTTPTPSGSTGVEPADGAEQLAPNAAVAKRDEVIKAAAGKASIAADADGGAATAQPEWRLRGRVVDLQGRPIQGASLLWIEEADDSLLRSLIDDLDVIENEAADAAATSDADGRFEIDVHQPGRFRVAARHSEHPVAEARVTVREGQPLDNEVLLTMRDGASIRGRVSGWPHDRPAELFVRASKVGGGSSLSLTSSTINLSGLLEDVGMPLGGKLVKVAGDGSFVLSGLGADLTYRVFGLRQLEGKPEGPMARCTTAVEVVASVSGVELQWRDAPTLGLQVVDASTSEPIERLVVSAGDVKSVGAFGFDLPVPARKKIPRRRWPDGRVLIDNLSVDDQAMERRLSVAVEADGYRTWSSSDVKLRAVGHVDLGTVRLEPAAVVELTVVASSTGEPIVGAAVELKPVDAKPAPVAGAAASGQGSISISASLGSQQKDQAAFAGFDLGARPDQLKTDAEGRCRLTAQFGGQARFIVKAEGWALHYGEVFDLPESGVHPMRIAMLSGGRVRVTALDSEGVPMPAAAVRRSGFHSEDVDALRTDSEGQAVFEHLMPGVHAFGLIKGDDGKSSGIMLKLTAMVDGIGPQRGERADVADGEQVDVELRAPLMCGLRGIVTLDGVTLERAMLRVVRPSEAGGAAEIEAAAAEVARSAMRMGRGGGESSGAKTDVDGMFEFESVQVGSVQVVVSHTDLAMPAHFDVELRRGDNVHDIALRGTTISGRVVDEAGEPIAGARVSASVKATGVSDAIDRMREMSAALLGGGLGGGAKAGTQRTDADGRFALRGVQAGVELVVAVEARRRVARQLVVDLVEEGAVRRLDDLVLQSAARVRWEAGSKDRGPGRVVARAVDANGIAIEGMPELSGLLRRGRCTLDGLAAGRWRFDFEMLEASQAVEAQTLTLEAGETRRLRY